MSLILSGTDGLSDVDGTVSTPAIRGTDSNTGIFFPAADTIAFTEGGVESMRIDSSGNVGIGTSSPNGKVDIVSSSAGANTNTLFLTNSSGTAGTATSLVFGVGSDPTNRQAVIRGINAGGNAINLAFLTSDGDVPAERMRITSAGNVGIGASNPAAKLDIRGSSPELYVAQDGSNNGVALAWDNSNAFAKINTIGAAWPILFLQNGSERMRISGDGYLKASDNGTYISSTGVYHELMQSRNDSYALRVGITAASGGGYPLQLCWVTQTNNNTTDRYLTCSDATNTKMQVFSNGNIQNLNGSYGTISDIKNKENIVDATPKLDKVNQLKVRNFNLKDDETKLKQIGFIAQEFEEVFPSMIEESPDIDNEGNKTGETTKAIKTSVLIPILVKAIQEQQTLIENLTTRLNALEGK